MDFRGSRRVWITAAAAVSAVVALTLSATGCSLGHSESDAEALVRHFTEALDHQDVTNAAALTSYPNAATATIQQMFDGLKADAVDYKLTQFIGLDDASGFFTMDVAWHIGENKDWIYSVQGSVRRLAVGWRISWDPSVVMPELGHQRTVKLIRTDAAPPLVDALNGPVLMAEQPVNAILLDPAKMPDPGATTAAVAATIEPVAPLVTSQTLLQDLVVAQGKPITAVTLRDPDFEILGPALTGIPGVSVEKQPRLLSVDRRIGSPVLDGLRNLWQANRDTTAGWAVQTFEADGKPAVRMAGYQGPPGPDIAATMDTRLQLAATDAVASIATPAAIVAIQPSTGSVLAVAQNGSATDLGPIALTGLFPAGSNLDLFKTAAGAETGTPPSDVTADDTVQYASRLGLGVDFKIPGLNETTGRLPESGMGLEPARSEPTNSDAVLVSPFGMAVAAATVTHGNLVIPQIALGHPGSTLAHPEPLRPDVIERLRARMREAANGPGTEALHAFPDVVGMPATTGPDQWFVGNRGDVAFAVFAQNPETTDTAMKLTSRMFAALVSQPAA
ncbi:NTF2-like N-terminal transpeptidase domain-containing protein [Skermania piniformis]